MRQIASFEAPDGRSKCNRPPIHRDRPTLTAKLIRATKNIPTTPRNCDSNDFTLGTLLHSRTIRDVEPHISPVKTRLNFHPPVGTGKRCLHWIVHRHPGGRPVRPGRVCNATRVRNNITESLVPDTAVWLQRRRDPLSRRARMSSARCMPGRPPASGVNKLLASNTVTARLLSAHRSTSGVMTGEV